MCFTSGSMGIEGLKNGDGVRDALTGIPINAFILSFRFVLGFFDRGSAGFLRCGTSR